MSPFRAIMAVKLSTLSICLGLCVAAINLYGLLQPAGLKDIVRKLPRSLPDLDGAVINTNIILEAKIDPNTALFREGVDSPYANDIVVRKGDETRPEVQKLVAALQSKDVKDFIKQKYGVAVVPAFK